MGFDQYHEPPEELSQETRTFARMIQSLIEEAEAIDWYEQRLDVEKDAAARGDHGERTAGGVQAFRDGPRVPAPQEDEVAESLQGVLFQEGDIVHSANRPKRRSRTPSDSQPEPGRKPLCHAATASARRRRPSAARCAAVRTGRQKAARPRGARQTGQSLCSALSRRRGAYRDRTDDLRFAKPTLSQLS